MPKNLCSSPSCPNSAPWFVVLPACSLLLKLIKERDRAQPVQANQTAAAYLSAASFCTVAVLSLGPALWLRGLEISSRQLTRVVVGFIVH